MSSISKPLNKSLDQAMASRSAQRRAAFEKKADEAELAKKIGNDFFKCGDYENAMESYLEAIRLNPTQPNYYSNMAAAKIKVEQFEEAEEFALVALTMDPRHMKARYRRLQARKSMQSYESALCDAKAMLSVDPNCTEAQVELKDLERLRGLRAPSWEGPDDEDDWPNPLEHERISFDPEDWSDSEDSEHNGNNVPCKYYNHDGCLRGETCTFSHAPDDLSERDRLGKKVCIFFLLGNCKFGDAKCNYSHLKSALPPTGWWVDPAGTAAMANQMKSLGRSGALKARLTKHSDSMLPPRVPQVKKAKGTGPVKGKGRAKGSKAKARIGQRTYRGRPRWCDDEDDEILERIENYGFTEDDVAELLSQGVKPWDDDAADVLAVLNGGFY